MKHKKIRGLPMPKGSCKSSCKDKHPKEDKQERKEHGKKRSDKKFKKVLHEYKEGTLHSGSKKGTKVKNVKQAVAIAYSEARKGYKKKKK